MTVQVPLPCTPSATGLLNPSRFMLVSLARDYENGVADVVAFLGGGGAHVERDVRIRGTRSGSWRQLDVVVRGRVFGLTRGRRAPFQRLFVCR